MGVTIDWESRETSLPDGLVVERAIPGDENWLMTGVFLVVDEQVVLTEIRITPNTGDESMDPGEWSRNPRDLPEPNRTGITSRLLRRMPIGRFIRETHSARRLIAQHGDDEAKALLLPKGWAKALKREPGRPGRAGRDDAYYLRWAVLYLDRIGSSRPIAELAEVHGLQPGQVRDLIHKARERGLLTQVGQGQAGGTLTPKARDLIRELAEGSEG